MLQTVRLKGLGAVGVHTRRDSVRAKQLVVRLLIAHSHEGRARLARPQRALRFLVGDDEAVLVQIDALRLLMVVPPHLYELRFTQRGEPAGHLTLSAQILQMEA
jgi:hypothetical protein